MMIPKCQLLTLIFACLYLVSLSQLNTVNNTDTVIDLNLNRNHVIDQPFSMDQQGIVSATGTFYYGIMAGDISTPLELF